MNNDNNSKNPFLTKSDEMFRISYQSSHKNDSFPEGDPNHGQGLNHCTWLIPEAQHNKCYNTPYSYVSGLIESFLEPSASIGWHTHHDTEETYYILEGELTVEYEDHEGKKYKDVLNKGDLHRVFKGMSHSAAAGHNGCRFIAMIIKQ